MLFIIVENSILFVQHCFNCFVYPWGVGGGGGGGGSLRLTFIVSSPGYYNEKTKTIHNLIDVFILELRTQAIAGETTSLSEDNAIIEN